jgi:hypothetical protein
MITNNYRILENIKSNLMMVREALDSENRVKDRHFITDRLVGDIASRLDVGAKRYGEEVPIEEDDGRDMGLEAYEELCDAAVYLSSLTLKLKQYNGDDETLKKEIVAINGVFFYTLYHTVLFLNAYEPKR